MLSKVATVGSVSSLFHLFSLEYGIKCLLLSRVNVLRLLYIYFEEQDINFEDMSLRMP
jgi:hypothetical protein